MITLPPGPNWWPKTIGEDDSNNATTDDGAVIIIDMTLAEWKQETHRTNPNIDEDDIISVPSLNIVEVEVGMSAVIRVSDPYKSTRFKSREQLNSFARRLILRRVRWVVGLYHSDDLIHVKGTLSDFVAGHTNTIECFVYEDPQDPNSKKCNADGSYELVEENFSEAFFDGLDEVGIEVTYAAVDDLDLPDDIKKARHAIEVARQEGRATEEAMAYFVKVDDMLKQQYKRMKPEERARHIHTIAGNADAYHVMGAQGLDLSTVGLLAGAANQPNSDGEPAETTTN